MPSRRSGAVENLVEQPIDRRRAGAHRIEQPARAAITANGAAPPPAQAARQRSTSASSPSPRASASRLIGDTYSPRPARSYSSSPRRRASSSRPARPSTIAWTPTNTGAPGPRQHLLAQRDRLVVAPGHHQRHRLRPVRAERVGLQFHGARGVARRRLGVAHRAGRRGRPGSAPAPRTDRAPGPDRRRSRASSWR